MVEEVESVYKSTLRFLYGLERHGIKLGLDVITTVLTRLGHPQKHYATLHIGGTNGKGSAAAIAASVLEAAGYKVGLYTSPHLIDFRERIRINGQCISEERVVELTARLRTVVGSSLSPTFFEFTTALALLLFAQENVDVAVVEVGMGGRFDATNVLNPLAVLITNVSLDHQNYLGHDLASIAFEKAGIIKNNIPVVTGNMEAEAMEVIQQQASKRGAACYRLGRDFDVVRRSPKIFQYTGLTRSYPDLTCALPGDHQLENAGCALALLENGMVKGLQISDEAVELALPSITWEGRLEKVGHSPTILLDGAHNPAAATALATYLIEEMQQRPGSRLILVVGMMHDKDHAGFFNIIGPLGDVMIVTQARLPRAARVEQLEISLKTFLGPIHQAPTPADALALAEKISHPPDLICVTGSLILVGEVKSLLRDGACTLLRG